MTRTTAAATAGLLLLAAAHGRAADLPAMRRAIFGSPGSASESDRAWGRSLASATGNPSPRVGVGQPVPGYPNAVSSRARLDDLEASRMTFQSPEEAKAFAEDYWKKQQDYLKDHPGELYPQALDVTGDTVTILEGPGVADPARRKKAMDAARPPGKSALRGTSGRTAGPLEKVDGLEDRLADLFHTGHAAETSPVASTTGGNKPKPSAGGGGGGGNPGGGAPGSRTGSTPKPSNGGSGANGGNDANGDPTGEGEQPTDEAPAEPAWHALHAGVTAGGLQIPRAGLRNSTLRAALGIAVEPYGTLTKKDDRDFVQGRTSQFGGPSDSGVGSKETGALTGERLRGLTGYFCAMRFDYGAAGKQGWANRRLLVLNPSTGKAVVVRCVDWGPRPNTRRTVDLSPAAMRALGVGTDSQAIVAFATDGAPLGPVTETAPATSAGTGE